MPQNTPDAAIPPPVIPDRIKPAAVNPSRRFCKRGIEKIINSWVQTFGILIAAVWAVWTFYFKEFVTPKAAPVNISLALQLKKIGKGTTDKGLTAVEMKIAATNPSSREIHLFPSAWIAYGNVIHPTTLEREKFLAAAADVLKPGSLYPMQRHADTESATLIAVGQIFSDNSLKPAESTGRTIVFHIPNNVYDLVDVKAVVPSSAQARDTQLEWSVGKEGTLTKTFYKLNQDRTRTILTPKAESLSDIQWEEAYGSISLWSEP